MRAWMRTVLILYRESVISRLFIDTALRGANMALPARYGYIVDHSSGVLCEQPRMLLFAASRLLSMTSIDVRAQLCLFVWCSEHHQYTMATHQLF